jgi:hypothetical protein
VLAESVRWPVTRTCYEFDPATETIAPVSVPWVDAPLPLLVAGFLFVSALAHTVLATVRYESYVAYLERGMNPYRWYEYAVSASLMICSTARRGAGRTTASARRPTSCSASSRSRCSPGRCTSGP